MIRRSLRDSSIGSKLTAIALITSTVALLVASAVFIVLDILGFRRSLLERTTIEAEMVGTNCSAALSFNDARGAREVLAALRANPRIDAAWAFTADWEVLASYFRLDRPIGAPGPERIRQESAEFASDHLEVFRPVIVDGRRVGTVVVRSNLSELNERYSYFFELLVLVLLAATAVAFVLVRLLLRFVTRPILQLTQTAQAVTANGNYALRAEVQANDELGSLVRCFNQMLSEIQRRDAELLAHRAHLEEQVSARTEELTRLNRELLDARNRAEAANRAKSTFLANMSHEIRTPITAIVGYTEMMLEPEQTASDRQDCLQVVRRNAAHLLDLVNDVLDLSKIEADKMTVERIQCDLLQLVSEVASLMRLRATDRGLGFQMRFGDPIPRALLTDPLRLRQILLNLLSNAVKFTSEGCVGLCVSCPPGAEDGSLCVRFDVSDTGIGMTAEQVAHLFQPFSQVDASMTRRFGGTGLGLAISKHLAGMLGGDISVRSTPGVGSVFTLEVDGGSRAGVEMLNGVTEPLLGPLAQPLQCGKQRQGKLEGRILFAEDGPDNQRLISTHLRKAGAEVVIAPNGKIAVDLMARERFDLVLMDMQMPVLDGYAAATLLREQGYRQPIVALTAHALAGDRARCIEAGCNDYLAKPVERDTLLAVVAAHLADARSAEAGRRPSTPPTPPRSATPSTSSLADCRQLAGQRSMGTPPPASAPAATQPASSTSTGRSASTGPHRSLFTCDPEMKELIEEYVERLPVEVAKLRTLLEERNFESLRQVAHQLKGSGGGYGFPRLTELAAAVVEELDGDGQNVNPDSLRYRIEALVGYARRIRGYNRALEAPQAAQRVLIIDDSPAIHALLRARLQDEPIVLHSAMSGEQGIELATSLLPDLILLDVEMPQPDGFEVCRQLKLDARLLSTPIIFLTAASSPEQKVRGLELGAVDYITKPFDPAELRARVRAALRMKFMMNLLTEKAQIDALTGLWNRRYFDQRFDIELAAARRTGRTLAMLMLDLDHFKQVNDQHGHSFGDEVLRRVGALLVENVRLEDTVCRYGGEEFAIIAPGTEDAATLAERLRAAVEGLSMMHGSTPVRLTVSIGVASATGEYSHSLVAEADAALYRAKQGGRNRVEHAPPRRAAR